MRSVGPRRCKGEEEGEENRVPREEVMLKDQSELNSSRVPRRYSTKIPTPCESSSNLERRPWLVRRRPVLPPPVETREQPWIQTHRPPYGRAKAARHARHATFPFLPARSPCPPGAPTARGDTCTATSVFRRELTLPDPFRRSNDQHQRGTLRLSLLPKTVFANGPLFTFDRHAIERNESKGETNGKGRKI